MERETQTKRAYESIKAEVLSGAFRPGERLESRLFEAKYDTSSTTVRMALSRLAGERLIESTALDGFHVPLISEAWLADLYLFNNEILSRCLVHSHGSTGVPQVTNEDDPVRLTERLFHEIAAGTGNYEFVATIDGVSGRLRAIRKTELIIIPAAADEITALTGMWIGQAHAELASGLQDYLKVRLDRLRELVRMTSRPPQ